MKKKCNHKWIFDLVIPCEFRFWNKYIYHCEKCCEIKIKSGGKRE